MSQTETNEPDEGRHFTHRYVGLITNVGGYLCRYILNCKISQEGENWGIAEFLEANKDQIIALKRRKVINDDQMKYLFPDGRPATSAEQFDITLIMFLFRNFLFLDENMRRQKLDDIPTDDTSVTADVARIKCYRNEMAHKITDTRTSISKHEFWMRWEDLKKIFLRLGDTFDIPEIVEIIDTELHAVLDEQREKKLDREIKNLRSDMNQNIEAMNQKLDDIKQIVSSKERSKNPVDDVLADEYFVKTEKYEEALKELQKRRILILQGAPGEGKTTFAKKLAKEVSKVDYIQITFLDDLKSIAPDVDTILIDDIFGARVFDKEESRIWQKKLPTLLTWIDSPGKDVPDTDSLERKDSPDKVNKHIVITSRTYILEQARKPLYFGNDIQEQNFFTLSSTDLKKEEKQSILEKHFETARKRLGKEHFTASNETEEEKKQAHEVLLESISGIKLTTTGTSFTIGFPECARLFANSAELYKIGTVFFQKPMQHVITCISDICEGDADVFIAFFVLWAQKSQTLTSRDLERSVSETPDCIKIPILKFQYHPDDRIRYIREKLVFHAHREGFITLVSDNVFRFSHNIVRDVVGLNAYHKNPTAVLELCDTAFIENYIQILKPSRDTTAEEVSPKHILPLLPQFRYDQLSLRIGELVIPEKQEAIDTLKSEGYEDIDKTSQNIKHFTIFMHSIFDNEEFCTAFIQYHRDRGNLKVLLTTELRTITSEFIRYIFLDLKANETAIRLPSFLIWQTESLSVFAKLLFKEMKKYPEILEKEMSIGMLIGSLFVSHEIVEFLSELGGKVTHKMILLAYETSKPSKLDEQKRQTCIQMLESKIGVAEPNCGFKIHAAAFEESLEIVEKILENDPEQANSTYTALDSTDLQKASLYHIAAYKQNSVLIETLVRYKVESNVFDAKGRSPFLYAICIGKYKVVDILYGIAVQHGHEMTPDDSKNTPLHMTIEKSVNERDEGIKHMFKQLSVKLSKGCNSKIHMKNQTDHTPLYVACEYNATEVVKEMMSGQKIHLAEEEKYLMHDFVMSGNKKAIQLLLKNGFDHNITDSDERTPLMLAEKLKKKEIAAFIKDLIKTKNVNPISSEP